MFPLFTNFALLTGLSALAAPVLIHLLLRRKSQRMRFSSIQFFVKRDEQSMRKRRLRNLFLLAARSLLFALIVLAFARPFLPTGGVADPGAKRQQAVIVLDTSASMLATGSTGPHWNKARELTRQILAGLKADDRAAIVTSSARSTVAAELSPPSVVEKKLAELTPTQGGGELADGVQQALKLISASSRGYETTLYVVSDLQRNGVQNLSSVPLPVELSVKVLDLGDRFLPNVAVTELRLEAEGQTGPHAVITSFSDQGYTALPVTLRIDGKEVFSRPVTLAAGATTNLPLAIPVLAPGWHGAELAIDPKDGLAADNSRFAAIRIPEPVHGLVVETRPSPRSYLEEGFFVAAALNPTKGSNQAAASRLDFEKVKVDALAASLESKPGQPKVEYVVLPAVKQFAAPALAALNKYVQNGGGLILFLGDAASANRYNTDLRDLLPAQLAGLEKTGEEAAPWRIGEFDKESPVFRLFRDPSQGDLTIPVFTKRFGLKPAPQTKVLAEFDDGAPLVVERKVGNGRVLLVNTSADANWTDWPKHKTFVPWMHACAFSAAGRDAARETREMPNFASGTDIDIELGTARQTVKLRTPAGVETTLAADDAGRLRDLALPVPGFYTLKDAAGREIRRIGVNLPAAESDLAMMGPADFQQQLARQSAPTGELPALFGDAGHGRELWRVLLLAALTLMLIEPIVANRTSA